MKLRELFEKAIQDLETYRHPDISEFQAELDALLKAAGIGSVSGDKIDSLYEAESVVHVLATWSVHGCSDINHYTFPSFLLDSDDYKKDATIWGLEKKLAEAKHDAVYLKNKAKSAESLVQWIEAELERLKNSNDSSPNDS